MSEGAYDLIFCLLINIHDPPSWALSLYIPSPCALLTHMTRRNESISTNSSSSMAEEEAVAAEEAAFAAQQRRPAVRTCQVGIIRIFPHSDREYNLRLDNDVNAESILYFRPNLSSLNKYMHPKPCSFHRHVAANACDLRHIISKGTFKRCLLPPRPLRS